MYMYTGKPFRPDWLNGVWRKLEV